MTTRSRISAARRPAHTRSQRSSKKPAPKQVRQATNRGIGQAPSTQLRQTDLVQLSRRNGNQHVLQLLGQTGTDTAAMAPDEVQAADLVGLRRGDGLNWGTEDKQVLVTRLQQLLNEKMSAGLAEDGYFGAKTEQILHEFQASMDRPPTNVVDAATADLLMTKVSPYDRGEELTDAQSQQVQKAGAELQSAGTWLRNVGERHRVAGRFMMLGEGGGRQGGAAIQLAGDALDKAGTHLHQMGKLFSAGVLTNVNLAGRLRQLMNEALQRASNHLDDAWKALEAAGHLAYYEAHLGLFGFRQMIDQLGQEMDSALVQIESFVPADGSGTRVGDPLVGLRRGDGISRSTWDRRPRVMVLQRLLNNLVTGWLKVDGKFGEATSDTLQTFRQEHGLPAGGRSVDAATARQMRRALQGNGAGPNLLRGAGNVMINSEQWLTKSQDFLGRAASALRGGPGEYDRQAGDMLQGAADHLAHVATGLENAGKILQKG